VNPKRAKQHIREFICSATALLLVVLHLFTLVGIDIHCDHESGRIYVVSGFSFSDCEHIHAASPCHHGAGDGACESDEDCCSDVFLSVLPQGDEAPFRPATDGQSLTGFPAFRTITPAVTGTSFQAPLKALSLDSSSLRSRLCVLRV